MAAGETGHERFGGRPPRLREPRTTPATVPVVSIPPFIDLPAGVAAEVWPVRGTRRAVLHGGVRDATTWVVLVPGYTGSKEDFLALLPLLMEAGVGVVTFDQLGQHESDASADARDYTLPLLAHDVAEVITLAAARFSRTDAPHLLGHSFGGLVAQQAVIDGVVRPASLTAFCSGPGAIPEAHQSSVGMLASALPTMTLAEIWPLKVARDAERGRVAPSPAVAEFLERRWLANDPLQLITCGRILMEHPDLSAHVLPRIEAGLRAHVVWGENDDAWPVAQQRAMAQRWGTSGVEIPDAGHSPNAEQPERTAQELLALWLA